MKINLGAGPYWHKDGWHVLDHKLSKPEPGKVNGDISKINLSSKSCDVAFTSHLRKHMRIKTNHFLKLLRKKIIHSDRI